MEAPSPTQHRGERRYRALAALGLLAVLAVFFHRSLFLGEVLSQADVLLAFAPWSDVAPEGYVPENELLADQATLTLPWLAFAAERVRAGELPLWNPYSYAGQPIHAANSGAFLWPFHALYYLVPSPRTFVWSAVLRLLLGGVFALAYLRAIGVSRAAAPAGACGFMLCGFLVVWLNHPHANVALTLPLHLWLVERVARDGRRRDGGWLALAVGAQLLGGHAQTSLHLILVVAAYGLFRMLAGTPRLARRGLAILAAGGGLGVLLAAPQLLPMAEYLAESRGVVVLEELEQTAEVDALDAAVLMVAPGAHGRPDRHDYTGPLGRNLNYNELAGGYVGRALLALAAVGVVLRRRDPRAWFFAAVVAGAALVAWQVWPVHDLFRAIPRLRSTNPTRLLLHVAFGLCALGALGLDALLARLAPRRRAAAGALAFGAVALELVLFGRGYNPEIDPALYFPPTPTTDFLAAQGPKPFRVVGVEGSTLRAAANVPYAIEMLTGYDKIEHERVVELVALLSNAPGDTFISEIPAFDRAEALPLASLLGVRYFVSTSELPAPLEIAHASAGGTRTYVNPFALPRAFAARAVQVVPDADARLARLGAPDLDPWTALVEAAPPAELGLPAALEPGAPIPLAGGTVELVRHAPLEIVIEADLAGPGLVVIADAWDRGWRAAADGRRVAIERVDHALRGVWLPAGRTRLELSYDPASVRIGAALAGVALAVVALWIARGTRAQPRGAAGRSTEA